MKDKFILRVRPSVFAEPARATTKTASWRDGKRSSTARGYTYEWQQARKEWLTTHPLCVMCMKAKRVCQANVVDHIKPHNGDMRLFWDRTNWQSLCAPCHNRVKQRMERAHKPVPRR